MQANDLFIVSKKVAIVILNWNGLQDTIECLHSVLQSDYSFFDVIVVDNGSSDASTVEIPRLFPSVIFIATGDNLGWAGGNNVGIKYALQNKYDYVFLLNNDTTVRVDCVSRLTSAAIKNKPALIHPAIYYYDEPEVAQLDPSAGLPAEAISAVMPLDHAYGAALFIDADIFQQVGLIDDRFFLQLEETDFFYRAKAFGIGSVCVIGARVMHKESRSFGGKVTPVKTYYIVRNTLLLIEKHHVAMGGYSKNLKRLLWTVNGIISTSRSLPAKWRLSDLFWLFSSNKTSYALRFSLFDHLKNNYGAIGRKKLNKLK